MDSLKLMAEGATASCMAAVVSNPFEVMKTRLQLQGELRKRGEYTVEYNGMVRGMIKIAKTEGIRALQKGIAASFCHQIAQNGTRLGLYPAIKENCERIVGTSGVAVNVGAGAAAGVLGAVVSSPFFMIKTRLQAQGNPGASGHTVGVQYQYSGVGDALVTIFREKGVRGLFHGTTSACWRTAVGSASQLATYDGCKERAMSYLDLPSHDVKVHLIAAAFAALAITVTMNPLDVVMTRSYNNDKHSYSTNVLSSLLKVVKIEGIEGLYKGSVALWARTAPHTICTFLCLEQIRSIRFEEFIDDDVEEVAIEG